MDCPAISVAKMPILLLPLLSQGENRVERGCPDKNFHWAGKCHPKVSIDDDAQSLTASVMIVNAYLSAKPALNKGSTL